MLDPKPRSSLSTQNSLNHVFVPFLSHFALLGCFCFIGLLCVYFVIFCVLCFISTCEHYFFKRYLIFWLLFICLFSRVREKAGLKLDRWEGRYDQEGAEVFVVRIYYLKKNQLKKRNRMSNIFF